ncbi:MAG: nitroreductase family protein [Nitrospinota bacterium]
MTTGTTTDLYSAYMEVVRSRHTIRKFKPGEIPREVYGKVIEAGRHSCSGANSQPWEYVVVEDPKIKEEIGEYFIHEARERAKMKMGFPSPNYNGLKTAPGMIVALVDYRYVNAFPVLNDGSELDKMYRANAERILIQSLAASVMSIHLAIASLGYTSWWVTAIGQERAQEALKPLLGVPDVLDLIDIIAFGHPEKEPYTRYKRPLEEIAHWGRYDAARTKMDEDIKDWIDNRRHKMMYRDEQKVD